MKQLMRCFAVGLFVILWLVYSIPASGADKTYKIRLTLYWPPSHHLVKTANFFSDRVKEYTKGRVNVEVYPSGQLYSQAESLKAVSMGSIEMSDEFMGKAETIDPLFGVVQTNMFVLTDYQMLWRYFDHPKFRQIIEGLYVNKMKVKPLFIVASGSHMMLTNSKHPISKPTDLSKMLIRVPSKSILEMINIWGGKGVIMSSGEQIMAMQVGTVDGSWTSLGDGVSRQIWDVQKYAMVFQSCVTHPFVINMRFFNSLPADIQKGIEKAAQETQDHGRKELEKIEAEQLKVLRSKITAHDMTPKEAEIWAQTIQPLIDKWVKTTGEKGKTLRDVMMQVRKDVLAGK
ncbi:MAG: C4-dicarboxylate-binding periplasmic protein precursor [Syntrophorhabdus sp. PtaU1.Bin058]|nr:MAG: C4-dicarboxylate-binding periplasmic protein precursor [Syntrophorhabdus sp. PtaU1.Bin058]